MLPVNEILRILGCDASAPPASAPPTRQLKTPSGRPASGLREVRKRVESGLSSEALMMMELPPARAGATFWARHARGALKGTMPAVMPQGWRRVYYSA